MATFAVTLGHICASDTLTLGYGRFVIAGTLKNVPGDPGIAAVIGPRVEIGAGTVIGAGAVIGADVKIGRDCNVGARTAIQFALIGNNVLIHPACSIGQDGYGFIFFGPEGHLKVPQTGRVLAAGNGPVVVPGLADPAAATQLVSMNSDAVSNFKVQGTPTFVLNGETLANVADWTVKDVPRARALLESICDKR